LQLLSENYIKKFINTNQSRNQLVGTCKEQAPTGLRLSKTKTFNCDIFTTNATASRRCQKVPKTYRNKRTKVKIMLQFLEKRDAMS